MKETGPPVVDILIVCAAGVAGGAANVSDVELNASVGNGEALRLACSAAVDRATTATLTDPDGANQAAPSLTSAICRR